MFCFGQDTLWKFESEKPDISYEIEYISDSIKDSLAPDYLNIQAYLHPDSTLVFGEKDSLYYQGFFLYTKRIYKTIHFDTNSGKNTVSSDEYSVDSRFGWITLWITFFYCFLFSFLVKKRYMGILVMAILYLIIMIPLATVAVVAEIKGVLIPLAIAMAAVVMMASLLLGQTSPYKQDNHKHIHQIRSIFMLIGMLVVWYLYDTPLYFIGTAAGILAGWLTFTLTENKALRDDTI